MFAPASSALLLSSSSLPFPLAGQPALVWLEGKIKQTAQIQLLSTCYLADASSRQLQIVCLD